jgi:AcrR family transcriptional regulator
MPVSVFPGNKTTFGERELEIIKTAGDLVLKLGYYRLNIGRIATALNISRATIYQYFSSKEDLLFALAGECLEKRLALLHRAATFHGRTRERMLAVGEAGELATRLYPDEMHITHLIRTQASLARATPERQVRVRTAQSQGIGIVLAIIRDAIAQEDLVMPVDASAESLCFGFWTVMVGGYSALDGALALSDMGLRDVYGAVRCNYHLLADGYGWRPLSSEWDYNAVIARVRETVFPRESKQAYERKSLHKGRNGRHRKQ